MGTGRLHLAVLPGLILLSLSLAERHSGSAGWVFTQPQLQASPGDSVLLQCLFIDPVAKGGTMAKVDWLRVAGAGTQKVGRDQGVGGGAGHGGGGGEGEQGSLAALGRLRESPSAWPGPQEVEGSPGWQRGTSTAPGGPTPQGNYRAGCCVLGLSKRAWE